MVLSIYSTDKEYEEELRRRKRLSFPNLLKTFLRTVCWFVVFVLFLSVLLIVAFKWVDPPISSFIAREMVRGLFSDETQPIRRKWVSLDRISPHMQLAALAAEDQRFPIHKGFDFKAIGKAVEHNRKSEKTYGASTISQQTAKNLFLWPGRSLFRKAMEAYFTVWLEWIWGKKRILEVYLNIAEMGPRIYGVEAAAGFYFKRTAAELTREQAALLAAVLPNPVLRSARSPSVYVLGRQKWILRQMKLLGDRQYLDRL